MTELTDTERRALDIEGTPWRSQGWKSEHVRQVQGHSLTRHYQQVLGLLDRPEALAYAPMTVRRLQRLQSSRRRERPRLGRTG